MRRKQKGRRIKKRGDKTTGKQERRGEEQRSGHQKRGIETTEQRKQERSNK